MIDAAAPARSPGALRALKASLGYRSTRAVRQQRRARGDNEYVQEKPEAGVEVAVRGHVAGGRRHPPVRGRCATISAVAKRRSQSSWTAGSWIRTGSTAPISAGGWEASNTDETLLEEIQTLYDSGFRGVELAMQSDGGAPDVTYAYGSAMWAHKWSLMMNKLLDLGMSVYLTSGTNWSTSTSRA